MPLLHMHSSTKQLASALTVPCARVMLGVLMSAMLAWALGCRSASSQSAPPNGIDTVSVRIIPGPSPAMSRLVTNIESIPLLARSSEAELIVLLADSSSMRFPLVMTSMGAPGESKSVTTMITADLPSQVLSGMLDLSVRASIDSKERLYNVRAEIDTAALELSPSLTMNADGTYRFGLRVTRRRLVPGEYFPSSEQLRVTVYNGKGSLVWSSDHGMAFLSVVMPVEPELNGASHQYTLDWNARASDGSKAPSGRYRVQLMLPVRPAPYSCSLDVVLP